MLFLSHLKKNSDNRLFYNSHKCQKVGHTISIYGKNICHTISIYGKNVSHTISIHGKMFIIEIS